jgi:5-methylcytosine-specific restriction protein A
MVHQSDWEVRMYDGLPEFIPPKWIDYSQVPRRRPRNSVWKPSGNALSRIRR